MVQEMHALGVTLIKSEEPVNETYVQEKEEVAETEVKPVKREPKVKKESLGDPADDAKKFLCDIFNAMDLDVAIDAKMEEQSVSIRPFRRKYGYCNR